MTVASNAPGPFFWGVIAAIIVYNGSIAYLMRYLRQRHNETWVALGSPSLFLNNSIRNSILMLRYLFRSDYRSLGDPSLNRVIWTVRTLFTIAGVGVAVNFLRPL
ncbi:MAG: hypothetical protein ISS15_14090 [Alphaproteobacteria bacterium]|nr:hypothetical protein [Alphaproteobacteria bacterium]MBL7098784.1 hypothetical protein [Alphaproteobacteria bacterium]